MDIRQQQQDYQQREDARRRREILAAADLKAVLESAEGRRFLRRLLAECGCGHSSFQGDGALVMAFREGRRSIGLWLQQQMADDFPERYLQLLTEDSNDRDNN